MRQVSKKDLARLKKRGGVKVKRRRSEKLESDVTGRQALSGAIEAPAPTPASNPLSPILEKITDVLVRLEERELPSASEKTVSMLIDAKEKTDEQEERERQINLAVNKAVEKERELLVLAPLPQVKVSQKKATIPWTHSVQRDNTGYIQKVVSSDESGNSWTHDILREDELITEVVSTRT